MFFIGMAENTTLPEQRRQLFDIARPPPQPTAVMDSGLRVQPQLITCKSQQKIAQMSSVAEK
jgi:hypothetical protein